MDWSEQWRMAMGRPRPETEPAEGPAIRLRRPGRPGWPPRRGSVGETTRRIVAALAGRWGSDRRMGGAARAAASPRTRPAPPPRDPRRQEAGTGRRRSRLELLRGGDGDPEPADRAMQSRFRGPEW